MINITLIDRTTGQTVALPPIAGPWLGIQDFIWTDGNWSCDCNRGREFCRALKIPYDESAEDRCGQERYFIESVMDSGVEVYTERELTTCR